MMRPLLTALFLLLPALAAAQTAARDAAPVPRLVDVTLSASVPESALRGAGLDVVEVHGGIARLIEWPGDERTLARLGATVTLIDADPSRTAAERARLELEARPAVRGTRVLSATRADGVYRTEVLPPFGSGSMGGFWTLAEVKMKLDELVANDTQDLVADKIDTIGTTLQGRPIWGLKIGKAVTGPDTRPVAFYNAITHAREPEGMQALLYFVDDLLTRYGSDPTATYLLDQRVIYIVPVVNPDGYERNRTTNPAGGGLWRKNLRDNNNNLIVDNNDGVDINRNFGFQWVGTGSSTVISAQDYRGPATWSEPETRAERDIVVALQPKTAISFHTYSDLFLHPWGYTTTATNDSSAFYEWDDDVTIGSGYTSGQGIRVLYGVNGEFNDWNYGDTGLKPRVFSWTPEVGDPTDGFWPAPSRILPLAVENLRKCYYVASIAGPYARVDRADVIDGPLTAASSHFVRVRARNKGLATAGPGLAATLSSLTAGASVLPGGVSYPDLPSLTSNDPLDNGAFLVAVDDTVTPGRLLRFQIDFTAPGGYFSRDTVELVSGVPTVLMNDPAENLTAWTTGSWSVVSTDPGHPDRYFADNPGAYIDNSNNPLTHTATFDLSTGVHAYALYDTRWQYEATYDCGVIEASLDGTTWFQVAATGTSLGRSGGTQPVSKPVYAGARNRWGGERADLSPFTGPAATAVRLRYRVLSDVGTRLGGTDLDSLRVLLYDPAAQPSPVAVGDGPTPLRLELSAPAPVPVRDGARFAFALPVAGPVRLALYDVTGRQVAVLADGPLGAGRWVRGWDGRDVAGRRAPPGVYLARLEGPGGSASRRFVVLH